jgi:hypothetical protein
MTTNTPTHPTAESIQRRREIERLVAGQSTTLAHFPGFLSPWRECNFTAMQALSQRRQIA